MEVRWSKCDDRGCLHSPAHVGDAGSDLSISGKAVGTTVRPHGKQIIPTGVKVEIPDGYVGLILGRSSTLRRYKLDVATGVIDSSYRGELGIQVYNISSYAELMITQQMILEGVRLAQLLIVPIVAIQPIECDEIEADTARGEGGFGSTGK